MKAKEAVEVALYGMLFALVMYIAYVIGMLNLGN